MNWTWLRFRLAQTFRCRHQWTPGDQRGHTACGKCGVWRWFPRVRRPIHSGEGDRV